MLDQHLVSLNNATLEIDTTIPSHPKGSTTMLTELLPSLNPTSDYLFDPSTSENTTSPTPEDTIPSNSRIQRLCSLYAHNLSDYGNARNFISQFGDQVRYVPTLGWLLYTGTHWQLDTTDQILTLAHTSLQFYYETADALADTDDALCTRLLKHAQRSQSASRLKAFLTLARSIPGISLLPDALNSHPNLIAVLNGTLDLTTLELHPHNPNHYLTRFIPLSYHSDTVSPAWTSFLDLLTNSDPALQHYLQLAIGYTLTGYTHERLSFLLHGPDQRPHQLFLSLINQIFGSYTQHLPLLKARSLNSSLIGARLLTTSTTAFLASCHYPTLAALLDADPIAPRSASLPSATFSPQAKLWLSTSVLPQLPLNLTSLSQSLKIIPLTPVFHHHTTQQLTNQLADALPAILTWAVQGAHQWSTQALSELEPTCVTTASLAFQEDQDTLASFLEACCIQNPDQSIPARDLYQAYALYTRSQGQTPLSEHKFSPLILTRAFTRTRHTAGRTYHGLALRLPLPQLALDLRPTSLTSLKLPQSASSHTQHPQTFFSADIPSYTPLPTSSPDQPSLSNPSHKRKNENILM